MHAEITVRLCPCRQFNQAGLVPKCNTMVDEFKRKRGKRAAPASDDAEGNLQGTRQVNGINAGRVSMLLDFHACTNSQGVCSAPGAIKWCSRLLIRCLARARL